MNNLIKETKKEITKMGNLLKKIDEFQCNAPQGCLKIQNRDENIYFYQQYMNESTKKWDRKYIRKENLSLAKELAQKHYYMAIKPVLEKSLNQLENFIKQYHPEEIDEIYGSLNSERRNLITPLHDSREEQIQKWNEEIHSIKNLVEETRKR